MHRVDLLVIAGEYSGDQHAAFFVRLLKERHPQLSICAVGGPALQQAGAHLLFNLMPWSVVGLTETLKYYRSFVRLLNWLTEWVHVYQPKIICLVDFPGFNLRLAKKLFDKKLSRKGGGEVRIFGYIAPQIWAWKASRRFKFERYLDHLAVIFPFEKTCFEDTLLDVQFVGHPLVQRANPFYYHVHGPLLLLPGSRIAAVKRIFPLLLEAFQQIRQRDPDLQAIVPFPNDDIKCYLQAFQGSNLRLCPLSELNCGVCGALMSSGTASLQVALAGIPGVVTYKANPLTFFLGKRFIKVPYLSMANILLKKPLYPECLQNIPHQAAAIAMHMQQFFDQAGDARRKFLENSYVLTEMLSVPSSKSVVDWLETFYV